MNDNTEPDKELSPEEEALVNQFVGQLNSDGKPMLATPIGMVPITDEQNERIQEAAVQRIIRAINAEQKPLVSRIIREVSGICFGSLLVIGTAYLVHAGVKAILGG